MQQLRESLSFLLLGQKGGQNRIQIIESLRDRPYNLNQLAERLDLNYRTVKHHIDLLLEHRIVTSSKTGGYGEVYFLSPQMEADMHIFEAVKRKLFSITASPGFFQDLLEQTDVAVIIVDESGSIFFWNKGTEKLFGYTEEDILGQQPPIFGDNEAFHDIMQRIAGDGNTHSRDTKGLCKSGEMADINIIVDSVKDENGEIIAFSILARDISDRKKAEDALKLSEERYALAQHAANIGSWDWNILEGGLEWSDNIEEMFGFEAGGFGKTYEAFIECVHPDDREHIISSVNACLEEGAEYDTEHRIVWPSGEVRWMSEKGDVIRDEQNKPIRMLGVVQDITEHKLMDEVLKEQKEKCRLAFDMSPDLFYRVSPDGKIMECNQTALDVLGYSSEELVGMPLFKLYAEESKQHARECFEEWKNSGKLRNKKLTILAKDGRKIEIELSVNTIYDEDGNVLSSISVQREIAGR
jgi:PAS domain S-box-containing protein